MNLVGNAGGQETLGVLLSKINDMPMLHTRRFAKVLYFALAVITLSLSYFIDKAIAKKQNLIDKSIEIKQEPEEGIVPNPFTLAVNKYGVGVVSGRSTFERIAKETGKTFDEVGSAFFDYVNPDNPVHSDLGQKVFAAFENRFDYADEQMSLDSDDTEEMATPLSMIHIKVSMPLVTKITKDDLDEVL
ncbi:MAG: hypothetical protein S4CHLAM20_09350 [Chlamydiia bacterium]|nr:hypothetical protein [Chlamydiia bacterium]